MLRKVMDEYALIPYKETAEEIKPTLYYDEKTDEVKGKCKLKPNKSYFAFEIREK